MLQPDVMAAVLEFRRKRNWEQFHKPKELAAAIAVEASELLEVFQWKSHEEVARLLEGSSRERVTDEIASLLSLPRPRPRCERCGALEAQEERGQVSGGEVVR